MEIYFEKYCMPEGEYEKQEAREEYINEKTGIIGARGKKYDKFYNHMPAYLIKSYLPKKVWEEYFKFTIVRNPFKKVVSYFHYMDEIFDRKRLCNHTKRRIIHRLVWNLQVPRDGGVVNRFRSWVNREDMLDRFVPFYPGFIKDRDKYIIDGDLCVDYVCKTENMVESIRQVCSVLNVPFNKDKIPKKKSGNRPENMSYKDYYDKNTAKVVEDKYDFEIKEFGYPSWVDVVNI